MPDEWSVCCVVGFTVPELTPPCLSDFKKEFTTNFEPQFQAARLEDELFKPANRILRTLASKYSNVQSLDKIRQLQARVEDVQMIMHENLSKAVDRGERLDAVEGKTGAYWSCLLPWLATGPRSTHGDPALHRQPRYFVRFVPPACHQDASFHAMPLLQDDCVGGVHHHCYHLVHCVDRGDIMSASSARVERT